MRKIALLAVLVASVASRPARAQEAPGQLGVGAYIGTPFGFTAKYLLDDRNAVDAAFGAQGDNFDVHADILTHFRGLSPQPSFGKFVPYVGLGLKLETQDDTLFGFRFLGGVSLLIKNTPLEAFAELAPVLRVAPSTGSNLDGGVGLRYYFGGSRRK